MNRRTIEDCDFCKKPIDDSTKGFKHGIDILNPFYPSFDELLHPEQNYNYSYKNASGNTTICKSCAIKLRDYIKAELILN